MLMMGVAFHQLSMFFTQIRMIWKKCLSRIGKIRVFLWFFSVLPIISSQKFHQPKLSNRHLTAPFSFPFSAPPNLDEKIGALSGGKHLAKMDGCKACFKKKSHGKSIGIYWESIGDLLETPMEIYWESIGDLLGIYWIHMMDSWKTSTLV